MKANLTLGVKLIKRPKSKRSAVETSILCSSVRNQAYTFSCSHLDAKLNGKFCLELQGT